MNNMEKANISKGTLRKTSRIYAYGLGEVLSNLASATFLQSESAVTPKYLFFPSVLWLTCEK
ncbi:hypothetical protein D5281_07065 [bacterium 1xD42-62]|uniref:Uncharacterized protein n=1 Tax=Parablautia muri TaxID=2320879 RepID=A0A9X5GQL0_9FIRM|nr:hypothetical protein [Parablautia muri]